MNRELFLNQMNTYFSMSDLKTMIFDLGFMSDEFPTFSGKMVLLIALYECMLQTNRLGELVLKCEVRDFVNWR